MSKQFMSSHLFYAEVGSITSMRIQHFVIPFSLHSLVQLSRAQIIVVVVEV